MFVTQNEELSIIKFSFLLQAFTGCDHDVTPQSSLRLTKQVEFLELLTSLHIFQTVNHFHVTSPIYLLTA